MMISHAFHDDLNFMMISAHDRECVGQACPPWLEYFTQGINKYCALLDEPRPAPTSQVGVVTELLVISREAQELVEVHAELLRQV